MALSERIIHDHIEWGSRLEGPNGLLLLPVTMFPIASSSSALHLSPVRQMIKNTACTLNTERDSKATGLEAYTFSIILGPNLSLLAEEQLTGLFVARFNTLTFVFSTSRCLLQLESYLTHGKIFVVVEGQSSQLQDISAGVPQG